MPLSLTQPKKACQKSACLISVSGVRGKYPSQTGKVKRLLILSDLYPTCQDSQKGIFVKHQVDELAHYYRVLVIAFHIGGSFKVERYIQGQVSVCSITYPALKVPFLSAFASFPVFALPVARQVCSRFRPDLIHVHDFRHIPELFWLKTWLDRLKQPKILTLHNIRTHPDRLDGNRLLPFYRKTLPKSFARWDHVFTVNKRLRDWLLPWQDADRISVLGNAIGPAPDCREEELIPIRSGLRKDSYKLLSVGNLTPEKGFSYLIDAVNILTDKGLDLQLVIVGKGTQRASLKAQISALGLDGIVRLTGGLDNHIVRNLYQYFDLFVLPSYSETFGIVFLEAMDAGLPVLGVEGEGIHGLFEQGREALFAQPRDSISLSNSIARFIQEPELATQLAQAGKMRVNKDFMMPGLIGRVREVYEQQ